MSRYLFDEDLQGVGKLFQTARGVYGDVWVVGNLPCDIASGTPDEIWLPEAGRLDLVIFRGDKDHLIRDTPSYRAWRFHGCKGFVLSIDESRETTWYQVHTLMRLWSRVEAWVEDHESDDSWIAKINRGGIKPA